MEAGLPPQAREHIGGESFRLKSQFIRVIRGLLFRFSGSAASTRAMSESGDRPKSFFRRNRSGHRTLAASRRVSVLIVLIAALTAALVVVQDMRATRELRDQIQEENRLRMLSSLGHVEGYFDAVYSALLFISLDNDVVALRRDSREFIEKLYHHEWEHHHLTEIYVVERDFTGRQQPLMTFERESPEMPVEQVHTPAREQQEYRTLMEQIQQFAANPGLRALLSREIRVCTPDEQGELSRGYVYSVPIRAQDQLIGIVAGITTTKTIIEALRHGLIGPTRFLVSERGDFVMPEAAGRGVEEWFALQFKSHGVAGFFAQASESFLVKDLPALWIPVEIVSGEKWWLVCLYDPEMDLHQTALSGFIGHILVAGSLLLAGFALAFLVRSLGKRLDQQARHLEERKQLERQVEEVSEREQRRIGESLHEDLCQRLTGIEAVSRHLEKRLAAAGLPEAGAASEIVAEIKESLTRARQMADELQPVSLLQHGFLAAIHELALNTTRRRGVPCKVEAADFTAELDAPVASHLYRIAQESVNNVLQHAKASQILLRVSADRETISFAVIDDGVGIGIDAAAREGPGMGLRIMRYRSDLIGGHFEARAAPGGGTIVSCRLPLAEPPKEIPHGR